MGEPLPDLTGRNLGTLGTVLGDAERKQAEEALRASQRRYALATAAGRVSVWDYNLQTGEVYLDPVLPSLLGLAEGEERTYAGWLRRIHPEDRPRVLALEQSTLAADAPIDQEGNTPVPEIEYRIFHQDGGIRWFLTRGTVLRRAGRPYRVVGTTTDITDRKQAEEARRESEERFRLMADRAPVMIWMSGPDALCTYFNRPWLAFTGRPLEREGGNGWVEGVHPEDRPGCLDTYRRAFAARQPFGMEYRLRRSDGEYRWVLDNGVPRFAADGSFAGYIGSCVDITERKQGEQALAERLRFEALLAEMSAAFLHVPPGDFDRLIEAWLERLAHYLAVDRGMLWQSPDGDLHVSHAWVAPGVQPLPPLIREADVPWSIRLIRRGEAVAFARLDDLPDEAAVDRETFRRFGLRSAARLPLLAGEEVLGVLVFGAVQAERDWPAELLSRLRLVGEVLANALVRRRMEEQARRRQAELAHAWRVAALGELAAALAHELNQPLTAILANAQATRRLLAAGRLETGELDEALADIVADATRAGDLIRRLRDWLRRGDLRREPLDLNEAIQALEPLARADALLHGITLRFALAPAIPEVQGDRLQLQQVVLNLIRNACEAMREGADLRSGVVVQTAPAEGGGVVVAVHDAGPFLDEDTLARMFDPFYTTKAGGLGVGLSISRSIVEAHGGRLWAERNPDGGLSVSFLIPEGRAAHEC